MLRSLFLRDVEEEEVLLLKCEKIKRNEWREYRTNFPPSALNRKGEGQRESGISSFKGKSNYNVRQFNGINVKSGARERWDAGR